MSIDTKLLRRIIEGALLAAGEPLSVQKLLSLFDPAEGEIDFAGETDEKPSKEELIAVLEDIQADCRGHGYELKEVGTGWRFQVIQETAPWVSRLWEEKPPRYSRALLETLALIAYRQPITRGDIESIRGVAVSSNIIKTLTEREWVKVVGHRDVPGRPALYATTKMFLDYFDLKSLDGLPSLSEIQDFEKFGAELELAIDNDQQNNDRVDSETEELPADDNADTESELDEGVDGEELDLLGDEVSEAVVSEEVSSDAGDMSDEATEDEKDSSISHI
ncbi:hypothetical protein NBRC116493_14360 [Aurantivibrio infirmus]